MNVIQKIAPIFLIGVACSSFAGEKINQTIAIESASSVNIENLRGQITVIGTNDDEVNVVGELEDDAERLIFEQKGSGILIKVVIPNRHRNGWNERGSKLTVHMPKEIRVNFDGVSSDISIENLHKSAEVKTVSGNVTAKNISEHIELISVSGDIESQNLSGKIHLSTVSGDINDKNSSGRIQLKAVSGEIESQSSASEVYINNVSGDIELTLDEVEELTISNVSGDSEAKLTLKDEGVVKMSSVSGSLYTQFQSGIAANFRLNANAGGDIVNKITNDRAIKAKYGPSSKLRFETGNANGSVRASTVSGTIKVSD